METVEDILDRLQRGLASYVSYLAACEMNSAFSEYVLYEPTLRILSARGFAVKCEVICPGFENNRRGDRKRLDFVVEGAGTQVAVEMKWHRGASCNIAKDREKLAAFRAHVPGSRAFLCVFGRASHLKRFSCGSEFKKIGRTVIADLFKTRYGSLVFEFTKNASD
jgi:hypothetical protein